MDEPSKPSAAPLPPSNGADPDSSELVYAFVRQVPPGKVVTYGQVAASLEGVSLSPREVGAAMRYAPADVPWQRVVGAGGHLPINKRSPEAALVQRHLLEQEGVPFVGDTDRIDMPKALWRTASPHTTQGSLFEEG